MAHQHVPVAILGATGMVGQRMVQLLKHHPFLKPTWFAASQRSAGKPYREAAEWRLYGESHAGFGDEIIAPCDPAALQGVPTDGPKIALSALDRGPAGAIEKAFAEAGWMVISNAASHRYEDDVPLIIPEVNPDHLAMVERQPWAGGIITNPNCTSMPVALALKPLIDAVGVQAVTMASYQAVSGAGYPGESAWDMIANVRPHPGNEEEKMALEPRKILGELTDAGVHYAEIDMSARCVRVPVADGHLVAVHVKTREPITPEQAEELYRNWKAPIDLHGSPKPLFRIADRRDRPSPRFDAEAGNGMAISIGRIEVCPVMGLKLFVLAHNTVRGAAGAAILNAELYLKSLEG